MPHQHALIIFVNNSNSTSESPLAEELGEKKTLVIQKTLTQITRSITDQLPYTKILFYSDFIDENDSWDNAIYHKQLQTGKDMGERMRNAFEFAFQLEEPPIRQASLIWGDISELTLWHLTKSYYALDTHDCVLGPTNQGGYYLLGMKTLIEEVFQNKQWTSPNLIRTTCDQIHELRKSYYLLPNIPDTNSVENFTPQFLKLLEDMGVFKRQEEGKQKTGGRE
jgi:uncharacterized protein